MMRGVSNKSRQICSFLCGVLLVVGFGFSVTVAHQCSHGHHHHHALDENVGSVKNDKERLLLPEEIVEEEDLKMMLAAHEVGHEYGHKHGGELMPSGLGLWIHAMGCSLLVSLASLICLILLPLIFIQGKPSKAVVDSLALFGAGAMLGDAFLHQLPHAFGGEHSHSHDHHDGQAELHVHSRHSHSLQDLSIGLSILAGIVVFLIVEKLVRYVDDFSGGVNAWSHHHHHHHHHHHKQSNELKDDEDTHEKFQGSVLEGKKEIVGKETSEKNELDKIPSDTPCGDEPCEKDVLRKRTTGNRAHENGTDICAEKISDINAESLDRKEPIKSQPNLVFGYLNLFSDGVHNFTDGMALGSAFLLYGSVGGWSRTLFLLAHELPQEIGDFGILVRSGFSVSKALFFNFLSALVALAGTALALMWGRDPGQSSLIEGFTAGGFIYIALAGVLAEMNSGGIPGMRSTTMQLISLLLGIAVALCISILE